MDHRTFFLAFAVQYMYHLSLVYDIPHTMTNDIKRPFVVYFLKTRTETPVVVVCSFNRKKRLSNRNSFTKRVKNEM